MIDEESPDFGSGDEGHIGKRLSRNRLQPVQWWNGESLNYKRTKGGMGAILPVLDEEKPVVKMVESPTPKPRSTKPRPRSKPAKNLAGSASSASSSSSGPHPNSLQAHGLLDHDQDLSLMDPLPAAIRVLNSEGQEIHVQSLARHIKTIQLEVLGGGGMSNSPHPLPHGGKAFEQPEFSSGILSLPPRSKKQREVANTNEIFYIISGPVNGLTLTLHKTPMRLSPGVQFMIPAGNTYELHNTSTKTIQMMFILVKPAAEWKQFMQRHMKAMTAASSSAASSSSSSRHHHSVDEEDDDDEVDEDEEDEEESEIESPPRRSSSHRKSNGRSATTGRRR